MTSLNALDLFCGVGGLIKGLVGQVNLTIDAGINVIAGIDIWDKAIESTKNFNHYAICEDLTKYPPERFQEEYQR